MWPVRRVEAELTLPDAAVQLLSSKWPVSKEQTFTGTQHLFAMYLSTSSSVEGRYFEYGENCQFSTVGSIFFRPAKLHLNVRGNVGQREGRAVHCSLEDHRINALSDADVIWTPHNLQAALNIRARHVQSHFLRLIRELKSPSFASPAIADAVLVLMVSDLLAYLSPETRARQARAAISDHAIAQIRDRIYDQQMTLPTVGELAQLCGISERHLLRVFRERQGITLIEFVRQARLEKGIELLINSDLPLKEIAFRLGFASHASFSAAFGRETGSSPAQFRRERRSAHPVSMRLNQQPTTVG